MEIKKVEYKDAIEIKKLLVNSPSIVNTGRLLPEILEHIDKEGCVANKIEKDGNILGVWLSKEFDTHTSLSYLFIAEELRKKSIVLELFTKSLIQISNSKPLVLSTKDTTGFEKYVKLVDEKNNLYEFKGFR